VFKPGQHGLNGLFKRHKDPLLDFAFLNAIPATRADVRTMLRALWSELREWFDLTKVPMLSPWRFEEASLRLHFHADLVLGPSIFQCDSFVQLLMQGHHALAIVNDLFRWCGVDRCWKDVAAWKGECCHTVVKSTLNGLVIRGADLSEKLAIRTGFSTYALV
jgi:hypothetical protein